LFDRGYVTVTPDLRFRVSSRIKKEFETGREYYRLDREPIRQPYRSELAPSREYLDWHASEGVRG
jgi:putative restriction endonuclease